MKKEERLKYKKKKDLYAKLGAEEFQKVVFLTEKVKYKIIKKFIPGFLDSYDKRIEKIQKKRLKKAKTEEEKQQINKEANYAKLKTHREIHKEQNRNYHMNRTDATEIYGYLKWNRQVHRKGLVVNGVFSTALIAGIIFAPSVATPYLIALLSIETIKAFVNFECINLQNYNICRYKLLEDRITEKEIKKVKTEIENYAEAAEIVHKEIVTKEKIPTVDEIMSDIETDKQREQLLNILLREKQRRDEEKEKHPVKIKKI